MRNFSRKEGSVENMHASGENLIKYKHVKNRSMVAVLSLFVIIIITILVTKVATIALVHTGLSRESARFQARSALTGTGFSTSESETVVSHPVRRRIILMLMLVGNAGIVTAVTSLMLTFMTPDTTESLMRNFGILVIGIVLIWWAAQSKLVDRALSRIIDRALRKYTDIDVRDYAALLHLSGDFQVTEFLVPEDHWMVSKTLDEVKLSHEGLIVLGVKRHDGSYLGIPSDKTEVIPGDLITFYGGSKTIRSIGKRKKGESGDLAHARAVDKQEKIVKEEHQEDEEVLKEQKED